MHMEPCSALAKPKLKITKSKWSKAFSLRTLRKFLTCAAFCFLSSALVFANTNSALLNIKQANVYHSDKPLHYPLTDYLISEKLDGIRARWTGEQLITKQGNTIQVPKWFTHTWPKLVLDGELWSKQGEFEQISSCVRNKSDDDSCWQKLKLMVFDLPEKSELAFYQRYQLFSELIAQLKSPTLSAIKQYSLPSQQALTTKLEQVISKKGEGLMMHYKYARYQSGRTNELLKLKKHQDAEALVIKHIDGKGKYQGKMGALLVTTVKHQDFPEPITFKIGTGFNDIERQQPPKVGDTITFKYFGKTKFGKPRFASFIRIRHPVSTNH